MTIGGFHGQYLVLDLASGRSEIVPLADDIIKDYIGGRGIGTKLLYDAQPAGVDALGKENHLIITTSPFTGTRIPGSSRITFTTKSPLAGTINATSMGGRFPIAFKQTGFDALILKGKSKDKVWLHLTPEGITIHPADDLWGKQASETETAVREKLDVKTRIACIGPAGENQVLISAIVSETHTAARGGAGAVMGSKNIKAIAVSGTVKTPIVEEAALRETIKLVREDQEENPAIIGIKMSGTAGMITVTDAMGNLPTRNFQTGTFENAEAVAGRAFVETRRIKPVACQHCPVACSSLSEIQSGKYQGKRTEGPEYESAAMFSSNLGIDNVDTVLAANYLCDEWGMDTISCANVIGFAMECYQRELLTKEDTGGLDLTWGNGDAVLELVDLIGKNEGIGARLGQGVAALSKEIPGSESFAMHVKGLELAAYDPRGIYAQGLSYAIAPRGGEHGRGGFMIREFFENDVDFYTHVGKAKKVVHAAEESAIYDLATMCTFCLIPLDLAAKLLQQVMGIAFTEESLRALTHKTMNLERKFNNREGFSKKDDTLPSRLLNEPLPEGTAEGKKVEGLDIMLAEFYELMGWDKQGNPLE
jgi:aldehyde:ferredoxin oxidoreductase